MTILANSTNEPSKTYSALRPGAHFDVTSHHEDHIASLESTNYYTIEQSTIYVLNIHDVSHTYWAIWC